MKFIQQSSYYVATLILILMGSCQLDSVNNLSDSEALKEALVDAYQNQEYTPPLDTLEIIQDNYWTYIENGKPSHNFLYEDLDIHLFDLTYNYLTLSGDTLQFHQHNARRKGVSGVIEKLNNDTLQIRLTTPLHSYMKSGKVLLFESDHSWKKDYEVAWYSYAEVNTELGKSCFNVECIDSNLYYCETYLDGELNERRVFYKIKEPEGLRERVQQALNKVNFEKTTFDRKHEIKYMGERLNEFRMKIGLTNGEVIDFTCEKKELHPHLEALKSAMRKRSGIRTRSEFPLLRKVFKLADKETDEIKSHRFKLPFLKLKPTYSQIMDKEMTIEDVPEPPPLLEVEDEEEIKQ